MERPRKPYCGAGLQLQVEYLRGASNNTIGANTICRVKKHPTNLWRAVVGCAIDKTDALQRCKADIAGGGGRGGVFREIMDGSRAGSN